MSESTDKATRRDLRRAVGTEAVSLIEQQGVALAHHAFVLNQHTQQLHEVSLRMEAMADAATRQELRIMGLEARVEALYARNWWQRVFGL